jgi:uncharacterized repeat protein (TIGR03803 family)
MEQINWRRRMCAVLALCTAMAVVLPAQTFATLHTFDGTDGAGPFAGLVQATTGYLYGTTSSGGANGYGTVFEITPNGSLTTLYSFCAQGGCPDGYEPLAGLVQATNGDFYGTTYSGGANSSGTVFKIAPTGKLTTLYSFCHQDGDICTDGERPESGLVQAANGDLYGTTAYGGANKNAACAFLTLTGCGTIFRITASGTLTTLYSFCSLSECTDGEGPVGGLVQATNGDFYGTTLEGGNSGLGTVFKITASGTLTTLYSFCSQAGCTDGQRPLGALVQDTTNGDFYGTTQFGGNSSGYGTVFKITLSGALTTLYRFCAQSGCTDGTGPGSGLVPASNGDLYGATAGGGAYGGGTVFSITPSGTLTTLYNFCSQSGCADGEDPSAAVVQATNGDFYGTTSRGGADGYGTVFSLSLHLGQFVELQPTSGKVGTPVKIRGNNLSGATSVTFNGCPATIEVSSKTVITTAVPTCATTGPVQVVTPHGTLTSNVPFRVLP